MARISKKRKDALAKFDSEKVYSLEAAAAILKEISYTKFDASVDIDVRLGVDPRKADQMVRGVVALPHGTGKSVRVLVLCTPDKVEEAKAAGADVVGAEDLIEQIKTGKIAFTPQGDLHAAPVSVYRYVNGQRQRVTAPSAAPEKQAKPAARTRK